MSLDDITIYNFRTSERILRFNERLMSTNDFQEGLTYIGVLFHALEHLNFRVRLSPTWNPITAEIEYDISKYFDIPKIMDILVDIDYASLQAELKFDLMFGFLKNLYCRRIIRYHQRNIRRAFTQLYYYTRALNNSRQLSFPNGTKSNPWDDNDVKKHKKKLQKECRQGRCELSVNILISFLKSFGQFYVAPNCNFVKLIKEGEEG